MTATKTQQTASDDAGRHSRAANGSAAVEAAKFRLVGAACMYGAGRAMLAKCAELGNYECFRKTMDDASEQLKAAARDYYAVVCEPPNAPHELPQREQP